MVRAVEVVSRCWSSIYGWLWLSQYSRWWLASSEVLRGVVIVSSQVFGHLRSFVSWSFKASLNKPKVENIKNTQRLTNLVITTVLCYFCFMFRSLNTIRLCVEKLLQFTDPAPSHLVLDPLELNSNRQPEERHIPVRQQPVTEHTHTHKLTYTAWFTGTIL